MMELLQKKKKNALLYQVVKLVNIDVKMEDVLTIKHYALLMMNISVMKEKKNVLMVYAIKIVKK